MNPILGIDKQVLNYVLYAIEDQLWDQLRKKVAFIIQNRIQEQFRKQSKLRLFDQIVVLIQIDNT